MPNDISTKVSRTGVDHLYPSALALAAGSDAAGLGEVGIVMRTKDRPLLLHRALASVLAQTHQEWCLYLINDGGDRATLEAVLDHYRFALGERLRVVHHARSKGMENASNAALALGNEEFVVVHDDDDSWHPDFLDATVGFLSDEENERIVAVTTGCVLIEERIVGEEVQEVQEHHWPHFRGLVDMRQMLVMNGIPPISMLFRRSAMREIGTFNGNLPVLGDWEFNIRLMTVGDIDFIDRPLARYHHRTRGAAGAYGNTVVDGARRHRRYEVLLRNSTLRVALRKEPHALGLVQAILASQALGIPGHEQMHSVQDPRSFDDAALDARMRAIEEALAEVRMTASWVSKALRPVHWAWRKALPVRRQIARFRGRI